MSIRETNYVLCSDRTELNYIKMFRPRKCMYYSRKRYTSLPYTKSAFQSVRNTSRSKERERDRYHQKFKRSPNYSVHVSLRRFLHTSRIYASCVCWDKKKYDHRKTMTFFMSWLVFSEIHPESSNMK